MLPDVLDKIKADKRFKEALWALGAAPAFIDCGGGRRRRRRRRRLRAVRAL